MWVGPGRACSCPLWSLSKSLAPLDRCGTCRAFGVFWSPRTPVCFSFISPRVIATCIAPGQEGLLGVGSFVSVEAKGSVSDANSSEMPLKAFESKHLPVIQARISCFSVCSFGQNFASLFRLPSSAPNKLIRFAARASKPSQRVTRTGLLIKFSTEQNEVVLSLSRSF